MLFLVFQLQFRVQIVHCMVELVCHFLTGCLEINVVNISSVGAYGQV